MLKTAVVRLSLSALFLVGCSDAVGPDPAPITELPRALTVAEQAVIRHGNAFGIDLMREVVSRDGRPNVILSPHIAGVTQEAMVRMSTQSAQNVLDHFDGKLDPDTVVNRAEIAA